MRHGGFEPPYQVLKTLILCMFSCFMDKIVDKIYIFQLYPHDWHTHLFSLTTFSFLFLISIQSNHKPPVHTIQRRFHKNDLLWLFVYTLSFTLTSLPLHFGHVIFNCFKFVIFNEFCKMWIVFKHCLICFVDFLFCQILMDHSLSSFSTIPPQLLSHSIYFQNFLKTLNFLSF